MVNPQAWMRKTMAQLRATAEKNGANCKPSKWRNNGVVYTDKDGAVCYLLHATEIVVFHHIGQAMVVHLDTGGYDTVTTRKAMNEALAALTVRDLCSVYRRKGETYCCDVTFDRNITVIVWPDEVVYCPDVGEEVRVARI